MKLILYFFSCQFFPVNLIYVSSDILKHSFVVNIGSRKKVHIGQRIDKCLHIFRVINIYIVTQRQDLKQERVGSGIIPYVPNYESMFDFHILKNALIT